MNMQRCSYSNPTLLFNTSKLFSILPSAFGLHPGSFSPAAAHTQLLLQGFRVHGLQRRMAYIQIVAVSLCDRGQVTQRKHQLPPMHNGNDCRTSDGCSANHMK